MSLHKRGLRHKCKPHSGHPRAIIVSLNPNLRDGVLNIHTLLCFFQRREASCKEGFFRRGAGDNRLFRLVGNKTIEIEYRNSEVVDVKTKACLLHCIVV